MRIGEWIVGALDNRQQRKLAGQAAVFQFINDVMKPGSGAIEDPVHIVMAVTVPAGPLPGAAAFRTLGKGKALNDARPQV